MQKPYQVCTECVMDNVTDSEISFDNRGQCNYCKNAENIGKQVYFPNEEGKSHIKNMLNQLKKKGEGKEYDCVMGISGGLDSAYLLMLGFKWGLRILALHIDDGFDTATAHDNIKKLCDATHTRLIVIQPDGTQFSELTRSYIMAEVPNIAVPQDNILFAELYHAAKEYRIHSFLTGTNFALESVSQSTHTHSAYDVTNIRAIFKEYGRGKIDKLHFITMFQKGVLNKYLYHVNTFSPLNWIDYNRQRAIDELHLFCGFEYYGSKHLENKLTKFVQLCWYRQKFQVDKRRWHLSSMIVSKQITREEAVTELKNEQIEDMEEDIRIICQSLDIERDRMNALLSRPGRQHNVFRTSSMDALGRAVIRAKYRGR